MLVVFLDDTLHGRTVIAHETIPEIQSLTFAGGSGTAAADRKHEAQRCAYRDRGLCEAPQSRNTL